MSLTVVGSVALDDVRTARAERKGILGGSASFFSVGASIFGPVRVVAVVGGDFPEAYKELFRKRNIDVEGLTEAEGKTFHWAGEYSADFSRRTSLRTDLNVFADFDPVLPRSYRQSSHVFLANIHPSLQLRVLDQVPQARFKAADTMNYWIDNAFDDLKRLLERVDLLAINDEEVRMLGGGTSIVEGAGKVLQMGPQALVVKRGEHGSTLFHSDGIFFLPSYPVHDVVDPTGAGDTFGAGLMGYLAHRVGGRPTFEDLRQALVCGTALASFSVEDFSLGGLLDLSLEQLEGRYREIAKMTCFDPLPTLASSTQ